VRGRRSSRAGADDIGGRERGRERGTAGAEKECYEQENWSDFAHGGEVLAGASANEPPEGSTPFYKSRRITLSALGFGVFRANLSQRFRIAGELLLTCLLDRVDKIWVKRD
jgi:hypothetical protein